MDSIASKTVHGSKYKTYRLRWPLYQFDNCIYLSTNLSFSSCKGKCQYIKIYQRDSECNLFIIMYFDWFYHKVRLPVLQMVGNEEQAHIPYSFFWGVLYGNCHLSVYDINWNSCIQSHVCNGNFPRYKLTLPSLKHSCYPFKQVESVNGLILRQWNVVGETK